MNKLPFSIINFQNYFLDKYFRDTKTSFQIGLPLSLSHFGGGGGGGVAAGVGGGGPTPEGTIFKLYLVIAT